MVADILKENLRQYDRVGRWGGEEFIVLLPTTSKNTAAEIAERLRHIISTKQQEIPESQKNDYANINIKVN